MPAIHDYICSACQYVDADRLDKADVCPNCDAENTFSITFQQWKKMEFNAQAPNDRLDSKGFIRKYSAGDDPLCMSQLGLGSKQLQSYNKMTPDESAEFRGRMATDGDSPKLRRDILAKYNEKVGNKYELQD